MLKLLLLAAFVANILIVESATDKIPISKVASKSSSSSSGDSSQSSQSSSSRSSTKSTAVTRVKDFKDEDDCHEENNTPKCKSNERYELCPFTLCQPQNCSELGYPIACPRVTPDGKCPGKPACVCVDGYLRKDNGVCVPKAQCESCAGDPNAQAGCGVFCKRCRGPVPCPKICRFNSCDCKPDFVYDDNTGKCVHPSKCTPVCKEHEEYSACINGGCFGARNCTEIGASIKCAKINPLYCEKGCLCTDGYLRDKHGVCIPQDQCPNINCNSHERYVKCPDFLCEPLTCSQLGYPQPCPLSGPDDKCPGKPACICEYGYVRNKHGVCIPQNQCPSCGGDPNAQAGCGQNCGRLCSNYNSTEPISCLLICRLYGCDCKPGYVYDQNTRKCVSPKDCTPHCGQGEEYSDCVNGGCFGAKDCTELGAPIKCVRIDPAYCKKGCRCKDDYVRDKNGVCISQNQCPCVCTGSNEVYDTCPPYCTVTTCDGIGKPVDCPPHAEVCRPACVCRSGYYRNNKGVCVSKEDCTPRCGQGEEYSDCVNGGCFGAKYCTEFGAPIKCVTIDPAYCKKGCRCKHDYVRDQHGVCIPQNHCPQANCDQNEVYDPCPALCPPRRCDVDDRTISCTTPPKLGDPDCQPGCRCEDGYARTKEGRCIPRDQCPKCTRPHEVYDDCPPICPPQTCESLNASYSCPNEIAHICEGACRCEPGYYRNKIGECVSKKQCRQCSGPNEYYSCGGACDNVCATLSQQNQTNCPIVNIKCNEMCYCESGYARDDNNICIPIEECKKCTGLDEVYDTCPPYCSVTTCDGIGKPVDCPPHAEVCRSACVCRSGYYRNDQGVCVSEEECTQCDQNEVYDLCPALCPPRRCDVDDSTIRCAASPKPGDPDCQPGCRCEDGYARTKEGRCIPRDQCPKCTRPHEVYDNCPPICPPQTCESLDASYRCPNESAHICEGACRCERGYYRNKIGQCISEKQCRKCTGPNEYYSCGVACDNVCATLNQQNQTDCPIVNKKCNEMCYCESGYCRDENKICIPIEECKKEDYEFTTYD